MDRHWRQQLERARFEAEWAERQYRAVEPEHRLVARSLEQRWEAALRELARLQEDYDRFGRQGPVAPSEAGACPGPVAGGAIPALWQAEGTTDADRKEVLRCLVEKVVVGVRQRSEQVRIHDQLARRTSSAITRQSGPCGDTTSCTTSTA